MQEHYIGSELLSLFCVWCVGFFFCCFLVVFFFSKTLGLSFWFELVLHGGYMSPRGRGRSQETHGGMLESLLWSHQQPLGFGAEELAIRGRPDPTLASSSMGQPGCPIRGTASLQPNGAAGTLTARAPLLRSAWSLLLEVPGPIPPLPNKAK